MNAQQPAPRPTTTRFQQPQPAPDFDQLAKRLDFDFTTLAQVSKDLQTLAEMVDAVRAEALAADKPLRIGDREASPFADPRAGAPGDVLVKNTRSVQKNVQESLADLRRSLAQTADALSKIATSVHDNSQESQKRLKQLLDSAFNPQAARPASQSTPPLRPAPRTTRRS